MDGRVNFLMRGKPELTKKRHQIGVLLKRATKGGKQAKDRLYKEFGIRVYSSKEVEEYVNEKLKTEMVEELPPEVSAKMVAKTVLKRKTGQPVRKK